MINYTKLNIVGILLFFTACATSMSPIEVHNILPTLTKSKFVTQSQADVSVEMSKCKYLVRNRSYVAPIGLSTKDDLKNGAKGIDEWVQLDGGNAYILKNFKWITVDDNGSTQLHVEFDTLLCDD